MTRSWTDTIAGLHPSIITGLFLLLFIGGAAAISLFPFASPTQMAVGAFVDLLMLGPLVLWHYSLRDAAERRSAARLGVRARKPWLFIVLIVAFPIFLVEQAVEFSGMIPSTPMLAASAAILMSVAVLGYFAAMWTTADALMRFEESAASVPFHKTIGTFILEFYLPIGIWFLHPRIRKMLADSDGVSLGATSSKR